MDVVPTTYPVVEGEWRKVINRAMVECEYCGKQASTGGPWWCTRNISAGPTRCERRSLRCGEKKQNVANEKAMRTLKIKQGKASDVS